MSIWQSLGLVPDGPRPVTPIPEHLLGLVAKPNNVTVEIKADGTDPERDTVPLMKKKIRKKAWQVADLAKELQGSSVYETARNDWNFVFRHIQYVEDPEEVEAVRDPAVTIHQGKGDCDCFTVLIGALLMAQQIPFKIRVAAYEKIGDWGHVYIVVPDGDEEIICDPVLHQFDAEADAIDIKDFDMKLVSLEGLSRSKSTPQAKPFGVAGLGDCNIVPGDQSRKLIRYVGTQQAVLWGNVPTQNFLEENGIPYTQQQGGNNETYFVISTPGGERNLPTIISQAQADKVKSMFASAGNKQAGMAGGMGAKLLWGALAIGGLVWLFSGSGSSVSGVGGQLDGPKKKKKKAGLASINI